jgi:hypothetical protein
MGGRGVAGRIACQARAVEGLRLATRSAPRALDSFPNHVASVQGESCWVREQGLSQSIQIALVAFAQSAGRPRWGETLATVDEATLKLGVVVRNRAAVGERRLD